jgi:hypothetical protein
MACAFYLSETPVLCWKLLLENEHFDAIFVLPFVAVECIVCC